MEAWQSRTRGRRLRALGASLLLAAVLSGSLAGQSVRGRVLERDAGAPIAGAFVELLAADPSRADAALTAPGGEFLLQAPRPGPYRLRVQRIGFGTWTSSVIRLGAGAAVSRQVRVPVRPVRLSELRVDTESPCRAHPGGGATTARLWEEARKALEQAEWADKEEVFRFVVERWERRLDPDLDDVEEERTWRKPGMVGTPFVSLPARELAEDGYMQVSPAGEGSGGYHEFFGPDAAVLLSEPFLQTHCFSVRRRGEGREGEIGLAFEPVPERDVPEIRGVLWLETATARLDRLEFRYVDLGLPGSVDTDPLGGEIHFRHLPNGAWIVGEWRLRMRIVGFRRRRPRLVGVEEAGGRVVEVLPAGAGRHPGAP